MNNIPINIKSLHINANKALKEKNYSQSKILLEKILLINPNIFEANFNLAMISLQLDDLDTSIKYFEKAKKLNPDASRVYLNLGLAYEKKKEINLAIINYQKIIEIDPNNSYAFYYLGSLYQEIYDMEKAEKNLKKCLDLKANFTDAYINLFSLYDRSNQLKKYSELLEKAKKIFNEKELIGFYSGIHEYKKKNYKSAIEILENINLNEKYFIQNIAKYGILAKCYDHIKKFDKAFNFFKKNNDLVKNHYGQNINENYFINYVNQRIEFFKDFKISSWKNYSKNEYRDPVFLIGFPRSGTTLLDTVLRTNTSIDVIEEKPILKNFLIKLEKKTKNDFNNLNTLDEEFIDQMQNFYFQEQKKYQKNKSTKIVINKLPLNIIHVGEILRFFPNAKFVFALRHPYDSVLSCFMQQFGPNRATIHFTSLRNTAIIYDLVMSLWFVYIEKFNLKTHQIKYEDVVKNFEYTIKELLDFLNLDWSEKLKSFNKTAIERGIINTPSSSQVNQPLYDRSIERWRNYENEFNEVKSILDKWVKKFNY